MQKWVIVANGGCSPIAATFNAPVTNVILSSPQRLPFFFEPTDPVKVRKSYQTLSGTIGKLFWWYVRSGLLL
jgi:hypothetical protein